MRRLQLLIALCVLSLCTARVQAQITWDDKYPKQGNFQGTVLVSGSAVPPTGWKLLDATVKIRMWQDGQNVQEAKVGLNNDGKTWGPSAVGVNLKTNAVYNVTAEIRIQNRDTGAVTTIISSPELAKGG